MRRLSLLISFTGFAACALVDSTGPDAPVLTVRLYDEIGANAGRNLVIVTYPASTRLETRTQPDGIVHIGVQEPGTYRIHVIPREGFLASDSLTKDVTVGVNERAVVFFTLHRAGCSTNCPTGY